MSRVYLRYSLIATTRRLTFDIHEQDPNTIWQGADDGDYFKFVASNGYEVMSRSRMDIQTERIWLLGAKWHDEDRSGSMVFSDDEKRDKAYAAFTQALSEWAEHQGGVAVNEAARPLAPLSEHADHVPEIAARLRLVAKLAGCPDAVPDKDRTAVGAIFSVLGNIRLHLERKATRPGVTEALQAYEAAFDSIFAQCCSNPVSNAWGNPVDLTKLNEAHELAGKALREAGGGT